MGLLRDRSIEEVVHHLGLVLPAKTPMSGRAVATRSAVVQARDRLGAAPLETLFETTAAHWATASANTHPWRGLTVYGVDGSSLRIPDTPENETAFERPGSSRGVAGYPQLRMVALMVLRSHLLAGLALGPGSAGETTLAEPLWTKLPDRSLVILDRGFLSYGLLHRLTTSGAERHWRMAPLWVACPVEVADVSLGEKLKVLRREKGWSQDELAFQAQIDGRQVSRYENDRVMPSVEVVIKLARAYNVSRDSLLRDEAPAGPSRCRSASSPSAC